MLISVFARTVLNYRYEVLWNVPLAFTLACWWVPTLRTYLSIDHVCVCNSFALAYMQPPLYLLDLCLNMMLSLVYLIRMCIVCVFTQQLDGVQPQRLHRLEYFRSDGSRTLGWVVCCIVTFYTSLFAWLLLIAVLTRTVLTVYVWSVVKRTHGVLPCTLVSVHLAHTYKYRVSTHMQSFCTCVPAATSFFAWLVFKYDVITRIFIWMCIVCVFTQRLDGVQP